MWIRTERNELLNSKLAAEVVQADPLTPGAVPPADGLQRRGAFIVPTRATMPEYRAHWQEKTESSKAESDGAPASTPDAMRDRQARRIRKLAALVNADELLAARRRIKPALQKSMSETDLHELALTLAYADKRENERQSEQARTAPRNKVAPGLTTNGYPREFDAGAAYRAAQAAKKITAKC